MGKSNQLKKSGKVNIIGSVHRFLSGEGLLSSEVGGE
jgi:hypothetical protein